jgi:hypothetical protein
MLPKFFRHGQVQDNGASIQEAAFEGAHASVAADDHHQPGGGDNSAEPVLASLADVQQVVERDSLYMSPSPSAPLAPERPREDAAKEAPGELARESSPEELTAEALPDETATSRPRLMPLRRGQNASKGKRLVAPDAAGPRPEITPQQRLLLLDTWRPSGLPAGDFASLVGVSKHTL